MAKSDFETMRDQINYLEFQLTNLRKCEDREKCPLCGGALVLFDVKTKIAEIIAQIAVLNPQFEALMQKEREEFKRKSAEQAKIDCEYLIRFKAFQKSWILLINSIIHNIQIGVKPERQNFTDIIDQKCWNDLLEQCLEQRNIDHYDFPELFFKFE